MFHTLKSQAEYYAELKRVVNFHYSFFGIDCNK